MPVLRGQVSCAEVFGGQFLAGRPDLDVEIDGEQFIKCLKVGLNLNFSHYVLLVIGF